jgi:hypothetical protein
VLEATMSIITPEKHMRERIRKEYNSGYISKIVEEDKLVLLLNCGHDYVNYYNKGVEIAKKFEGGPTILSAIIKDEPLPIHTESWKFLDSSRKFLEACEEYNMVKHQVFHAGLDNTKRFPIASQRLDNLHTNTYNWGGLKNVDTELLSRTAGFTRAIYEWIKDAAGLPPYPENTHPENQFFSGGQQSDTNLHSEEQSSSESSSEWEYMPDWDISVATQLVQKATEKLRRENREELT